MTMPCDSQIIARFDDGLNVRFPERSRLPATVVGYGEISAIFQIEGCPGWVFKRLPLFSDRRSARCYVEKFEEYCRLLETSGVHLPEQQAEVTQSPDRPVTVYIAQRLLDQSQFCHHLIHSFEPRAMEDMFENVVSAIDRIWHFNRKHLPTLELAIDGQLSNWSMGGADETGNPIYVDTSTPLFRKNGVEQMDPELLLQSAPGFLRWMLRAFFLDDVMNRYYNQRSVLMDLAANLYKEQRPDLIPMATKIVNRHLEPDSPALAPDEIKRYYRGDKLIWSLFLAFRRLDRWVKCCLLRQRYEFMLPGKIHR